MPFAFSLALPLLAGDYTDKSREFTLRHSRLPATSPATSRCVLPGLCPQSRLLTLSPRGSYQTATMAPPAPAPYRLSSKWLLLLSACVQNASCTGLLFGFAALRPLLLSLDGSCDASVSRAFTLAVTVNMLAPLLLAGPLLDVCGPRACSCACTGLVGAGFLLFGLSPSLPGGAGAAYVLPSMLLIGAGGPGCQLCLFHTANLFAARGMVMNLITASIGASFVTFELLARLSSPAEEVSLQRAFLGYSLLPLACTCVSAVTMPDSPFDARVADGGAGATARRSLASRGGGGGGAEDNEVASTPPPETPARPSPRSSARRASASVRAISRGAARSPTARSSGLAPP